MSKEDKPVTLCTSHTTTPSTIPKGKHVISVSRSTWWVYSNPLLISLYTCLRESCTELNSPGVNYTQYSNVSDFCLTINNLQKNEERYFLVTHYHPGPKYVLRVLSKSVFDVSSGGYVCICVECICFISIHCRGYTLYNVMLHR